MPLDRRITVHLEAIGTIISGIYIPGPVTDIPMWAAYADAGSTDQPEVDGIYVTSVATFLVRYREDIRRTPISRIGITDEYGTQWNCENITESDARRRYLTIQCIRIN